MKDNKDMYVWGGKPDARFSTQIGGSGGAPTEQLRDVFVGYTRVSTPSQAGGGLSLEGQADAIRGYVRDVDGALLAIHTNVASGGGKPELRQDLLAAIRLAKLEGADILVTQVDRLARGLDVLGLLKSEGVHVHVVGKGRIPYREVDRLLRKARRELYSKQASGKLRRAKKPGAGKVTQVLGSRETKARGAIAHSLRAQDRDRSMFRYFDTHPEVVAMTQAARAEHLNALGVFNKTRMNGPPVAWTKESVKKMWHRYCHHLAAEREMDQDDA
ncbi:recombinase family protein [Psychromarinibacter sp. S121]|uniref:recombinase family protein n=1 Tax=Psychromarinibacter sp. S121 TaxID=3415127 RepID=UPI003C7D2D0E